MFPKVNPKQSFPDMEKKKKEVIHDFFERVQNNSSEDEAFKRLTQK